MKITGPGQSALLLINIIAILNKKKIFYAIIGAFAASYYGVVRASLDADAVVSLLTFEDIENLVEELKLRGLAIVKHRGDLDDPIAMVINIKDKFSNRVDLLMGIRGMSLEVFSRVQKVKFKGVFINIVSLEDFIAMKIFAGNPIDMLDARGALNVSGKKVDIKLLQKLTANYGKDCLPKLKAMLK